MSIEEWDDVFEEINNEKEVLGDDESWNDSFGTVANRALEIRGFAADLNQERETWDEDFEDSMQSDKPRADSKNRTPFVLCFAKRTITQKQELEEQVRFIRQATARLNIEKSNFSKQSLSALDIPFTLPEFDDDHYRQKLQKKISSLIKETSVQKKVKRLNSLIETFQLLSPVTASLDYDEPSDMTALELPLCHAHLALAQILRHTDDVQRYKTETLSTAKYIKSTENSPEGLRVIVLVLLEVGDCRAAENVFLAFDAYFEAFKKLLAVDSESILWDYVGTTLFKMAHALHVSVSKEVISDEEKNEEAFDDFFDNDESDTEQKNDFVPIISILCNLAKRILVCVDNSEYMEQCNLLAERYPFNTAYEKKLLDVPHSPSFRSDSKEDSVSDEENWDEEIGIETVQQTGALASLLFFDQKEEYGVPTKCKVLEKALNKNYEIHKFPVPSHLLTKKLKVIFHEKELHTFLRNFFKAKVMKESSHFIPLGLNSFSGLSHTHEFTTHHSKHKNPFAVANVYPRFELPSRRHKQSHSRSHTTSLVSKLRELIVLAHELTQCGQSEAAWDLIVGTLSTLSERKEEQVVEADVADTVILLLTYSGRLWDVTRLNGWRIILTFAHAYTSPSHFRGRVDLVEQETYLHTWLRNDSALELWEENKEFEPNPLVKIVSFARAENKDSLTQALALADLILILNGHSPLTLEHTHGFDEDELFRLVSDSLELGDELSHTGNIAQFLLDSYSELPHVPVSAKMCLALALHYRTHMPEKCEAAALEGLCAPLCCGGVAYELLSVYGDVLVRNGKYAYGVLSLEASVYVLAHTHSLTQHSAALAVLARAGDLAAENDDTERAIRLYTVLLDTYLSEHRENESVFIARNLARLHADLGDLSGAESVLRRVAVRSLDIDLCTAIMYSQEISSAIALLEDMVSQSQQPGAPSHSGTTTAALKLLCRAYRRAGWYCEMEHTIKQLASAEARVAHRDMLWMTMKTTVPHSWRFVAQYYIGTNQLTKALGCADCALKHLPANRLLERARWLRTRGEVLAGLWHLNYHTQYHTTATDENSISDKNSTKNTDTQSNANSHGMITSEECVEFEFVRMFNNLKDQSNAPTEISTCDIYAEAYGSLRKAADLFEAAGNEWKQCKAQIKIIKLFCDAAFIPVVFFKRPLEDVFPVASLSFSPLINLHTPNNYNLRDIGHILTHVLEYAGDVLDLDLLADALLGGAVIRMLEEREEHALEFWRHWRDLLLPIHTRKAHLLGRHCSLVHANSVLNSVRWGALVLLGFNEETVNANLGVLDTLLGIEQDVLSIEKFSIKEGFLKRSETLSQPQSQNTTQAFQKHSSSSSNVPFSQQNNRWKVYLQDPAVQCAREIWNKKHAMKVQIKKYVNGKVQIEKLQHRNEASLKAINELTQKVRCVPNEGLSSCSSISSMDFRSDQLKYRRSRRFSVLSAREGFEEEFRSIKNSIFIIFIQKHIFFYIPHRLSLQVSPIISHVNSLSNSLVSAPATSITVRFTLIVKRRTSVEVTANSRSTIGQLIGLLCQIFNETTTEPKNTVTLERQGFILKFTNFHKFQSSMLHLKANTGYTNFLSQAFAIKRKRGNELPSNYSFAMLSNTKTLELFSKTMSNDHDRTTNTISFSPELMGFLNTLLTPNTSSSKAEKNYRNAVICTIKELHSTLLPITDHLTTPISGQHKSYSNFQKPQNKTPPNITAKGTPIQSTLKSLSLPTQDGPMFTKTTVNKVFCSQTLQLIPWELLIKNCIRYSGFNEFLGLARSRTVSTNNYSYIVPLFKKNERENEEERQNFVLRKAIARLQFTPLPIFSKELCSNSLPVFSDLSAEYFPKWKSEKQKTKPSSLLDLGGIFALDVCAELGELINALNGNKKYVLLLTTFDLIDSPETIQFIFRNCPNVTGLFVPPCGMEKLIKVFKFFQKEKIVPLPEQLGEKFNSETSLPFVLYNYV